MGRWAGGRPISHSKLNEFSCVTVTTQDCPCRWRKIKQLCVCDGIDLCCLREGVAEEFY